MTLGVFQNPPTPGMAAAIESTKARAACLRASLLIAGLILALGGSVLAAKSNQLPEGTISEIKVEGNTSITVEQVRAEIKSRVGRPLDRATVEQDMKTLLARKWFSEVAPVFDDQTAAGKGIILIFRVTEMPILRDVQFIGLNGSMGHVKLKDIEEATGLKKGGRADSVRARLAVQQIQTLYEEKGFEKAEIRLIEGGNAGDTRVIIEIYEGPKFKIGSIDFVGNSFVEDAVLATKIESRKGLFGLMAKRHKDGLESDRRALIRYYTDNGFFDVRISAVARPGASLGDEQITFTISEGPQYKVRNIVFEGNKKIPEAELREGLLLKAGQPYNEGMRDLDFKTINTRYWSIGCIDTHIEKDQPVTEEPGFVDLVYRIEEGEPYYVGQFIVRGSGRTKEKVVRREALMAGVLPGEVLDLNRIDKFKMRLGNTGYFVKDPAQGKPIDVQIVNKRPGDKPFGMDVSFDPNGVNLTRMQSPDPDLQLPGEPPAMPPLDVPAPEILTPDPAPSAPRSAPAGPEGLMPFGGLGPSFAPPANSVPPGPAPIIPAGPPQGVPGNRPVPNTPSGEDPGFFPSLPNNNMNDVGPDRQEPNPNRAYADIVTNVDEAPTGRLLFGVGGSSQGGLSGNLIFHESNFDLFAIPRSFADLSSGRAFRGAGQEFRVELSPGTLINRYVVSFRDPYLFDLPIGLGVSGYQFTRNYPDFNERRSGGRVSLGYQYGPQTYADIAARIEDVNISGFSYPAPAELLAVSGSTTLFTLRPSIRFDNRNNPNAPSQGSYLEAAFEQGFGTFSFPKFTLEGRQHFTLGSRPDGSGKRTLALRGFYGVTGRDTPIYERFFAGDFRSMRGFYYRGVGPHVLGVNTGGVMTAIGSIEYQFPWTASDKLQQVFFCDFGTVEADYSFTTFRAAVGTGLRVVIPQITGQLPLAFDLAFPVSKAEGDRVRYFSFFIGAFW
ncbi:POTRA domain-containing protein [Tundrisphaera lichenicola]|uniref:POTRA domain-containing protein n=1 Tax=Tundrisphaera lichenicola TaxID=2029860 RepID=UPI003EB84715